MGVGRVYMGEGFASCRSFNIVLLVVVFICLLLIAPNHQTLL
jgi:hypothetical protein